MTEQRRKYAHNRVLIESARILSAQFDDAVIYVSGAQLELLRNVTQYLNRITTYVDEAHVDYYLVPDAEDFDDILSIVADLEEVLMGNPNTIWGYKEQWYEQKVGTSTGESTTKAITTAVPAGYVYVLENVFFYHSDTTTRACQLYADVQTGNVSLWAAPSQPADESIKLPANVTLKEGDTVVWNIEQLADTKTCLLRVLGYKMVVP